MRSSWRFGLLAVAIPAVGLLAAPMVAPAAASATSVPSVLPFQGVSAGTSSNWSGYAAHGGANSYNSVSATWVQPAGSCTKKTTYAAFWVGLDGYSSKTVEQTGSEVDCSGGSPVYYAWYEMYPAYPVNFADSVSPGDKIKASVAASGDVFTLKIADVTQGWQHIVTKTLSSPQKSSAEVIAEAPCCTADGSSLPLTDFGTVAFKRSDANGSAIGISNPTRIKMGPVDGGTDTDTTSALTDGNKFSVTWEGN